jgi:predicted secreted Zn-dependent protease
MPGDACGKTISASDYEFVKLVCIHITKTSFFMQLDITYMLPNVNSSLPPDKKTCYKPQIG